MASPERYNIEHAVIDVEYAGGELSPGSIFSSITGGPGIAKWRMLAHIQSPESRHPVHDDYVIEFQAPLGRDLDNLQALGPWLEDMQNARREVQHALLTDGWRPSGHGAAHWWSDEYERSVPRASERQPLKSRDSDAGVWPHQVPSPSLGKQSDIATEFRESEEIPWWIQIGSKRSAVQVGVYSEDGSFLPRVNKWITLLVSVAICGAFMLAAETENILPLLAIGAFFGGIIVATPIWRDRLGWKVALTAWLIGCAVAIGLHFANMSTRQVVGLAVLAVVVAGWIMRFYGESSSMPESERTWRSTVRAVGIFAAISIGGLIASLGLFVGPSEWYPSFSQALQWVLLLIAAGGAISALVVAAMAGFSHTSDLPVRREAIRPERKYVHKSGQGSGSTPKAFNEMINRISVVVAVSIENLWANVKYTLRIIVCAVQNFFSAAAMALRKSIQYGKGFALESARVVLVPAVTVALAGWLLLVWSEQNLVYLVHGSFSSLFASIGSALGVVLALSVTWMALSGRPAGESMNAARASALYSLSPMLFLIAVGGWIVGIPGTLGYTRIHVGWITGGATLILIIGFIAGRKEFQHREK
ncbi:hypothetical protein [Streptomyces sp. NRRL B-1140]|uniref:hypothetical protein n=1 Tax=Streptomyces sp. NRRL B-1140 TaxID=1415549 RepID=UPI000B013A5C|nr:hypothetical protein [Streptomyces sp. NRRL B-1140]